MAELLNEQCSLNMITRSKIRPLQQDFELTAECNNQTLDFTMRRFRCFVCKKSLSTKDTLRKHILSKHIKLKPFQCDECGKSFMFEKALLAHKNIHNQVPLFACVCGIKFKVESSYLDHIRRLHQAVPSSPFNCTVCGKSFYDRQTLRMHLTAVHKPKTIKCSDTACNRLFSTISLMHAHYRCHSDDYNICSECGKSFKSEAYLQKHKLTHEGIRPFQCSECSKTYMSVSHLNQHFKRAHIVTNSFQCVYCGKCFKNKEQVTYHENAHEGKKPFVCDVCDYRTAYRNTLCSHRKKVHSHLNILNGTKTKLKENLIKPKIKTGNLKGINKKLMLNKQLESKRNQKSFPQKVLSKQSLVTPVHKTKRVSKSKSKGDSAKLYVESLKLVEKDFDSIGSNSLFNNLETNESTSLSVGDSFLKASSMNFLWDSDVYPDWVYPDQSTHEKKNDTNEEISIKQSTSNYPKGPLNMNITLNSTALDYSVVQTDASFATYYDF